MRPRTLPALLLLAAASLPAPPAAGDDEASPAARMLEEFRRQWRRDSVEAKAAAFRLLDATSADSLPAIYEGFRYPHWLVRGAAAETAARVPEGPLRFQLRLDLLAHDENPVRQGIAHALGLDARPGDGEALAGALEDRDPLVRRDAARGLRRLPSRGALVALVRALARETDPRARVWILDTLRALAREDRGRDPLAWAAWWEEKKDDPDLRPPEEVPPEKRKFAGITLEVVTVPARRPPGGEDRARRPALFVLAPFGWDHDYFRPYLDELRDTFTVSYIRLPAVADLTGNSGYGSQIPTYPVGDLARAFEALRRDRGVERVVLLGDGAAAWIAEAYAVMFPGRTAGLLLLGGWLDAPAYAAALRRTAARGSPEERARARSLLGEEAGARDRAEERWMARVDLTHSLADPSDLEGHRLWTRARDPGGFASVPSLTFGPRTRVETPALFVFPAGSAMSGHPEAPRVRDAFPNSIVATMDDTRGFPWMDRHDEFHRIVRGFVERYRLDR